MFAKLKKMLEMASATQRKEPVAGCWLAAGEGQDSLHPGGADARAQNILYKNMCK